MRLFTLIDLQHLILAVFLGLAAAIVVYLAFRNGPGRLPAGREDRLYGDDPVGHGGDHRSIPVVLLLVYLGFAVWFVFYVVFFALRGSPF
jgi:hypothetical protein